MKTEVLDAGSIASYDEEVDVLVVGLGVAGAATAIAARESDVDVLVAERAGGGGGSIVNVSSGAIDLPVSGFGLYSLTKAAVAQLTHSLAQEVGDRGIRVNALAPGATITNFTKRRLVQPDGSIDSDDYAQFVGSMQAMSPIGQVGEAVDQAWLVLYLASEASRFCTGQIWRSNGGATTGR